MGIQRDSPGAGIGPSGDTKDESDPNRRDNFDSNNRRPQNQGHYNNMNNFRNDQYHNRRGGGRGAGDREHDSYGRQQQQGNNEWGNNGNRQNEFHRGEPFQRGGRGGRFDNYSRDGRNNQAGGPPRFNPRSDDRYNEAPSVPQQPPRFQRSSPIDTQPADPNNPNTPDRLAPRFKKLSLGQGPPERAPGDIGGGGPPSNREQGGRGMHNNRQIMPDQRYQDRSAMFQQPPPNYQPDPQRNLGVLGPG